MVATNEGAEPTAGQLAQIGYRERLAFAALVLGFVSFLNLLGAEKSVPAIVLAAIALSGCKNAVTRRRAWIALALGVLHVFTIAVVLLVFRDRLGELIRLLHTLG